LDDLTACLNDLLMVFSMVGWSHQAARYAATASRPFRPS
jgi:hypothetical protein